MIGALLAATVLFLQAAPAVEPAAPPAPATATAGNTVSPAVVVGKRAPTQAERDAEVVCRTEPVLGTLFPKKICARRDQLAERTREDQKATREATNLRPYKLTDGIGP